MSNIKFEYIYPDESSHIFLPYVSIEDNNLAITPVNIPKSRFITLNSNDITNYVDTDYVNTDYIKKILLKEHNYSTRTPRITYKPLIFSCKCGRNYKTYHSLRNHVSICDLLEKKKKIPRLTYTCPDCGISCKGKDGIRYHYHISHGYEVDENENFTFKSFQEFSDWKNKMCSETNFQYNKCAKKKNRIYYKCHRDGFYNFTSKSIKKRRRYGSNKIESHCPARINVLIEKDGTLYVKFCKTHICHKIDLFRLDRMKKKEGEKKLKANDEIHNDIPSIYHDHDSPREESPLPESYPILAGHANDVFRLDKMIKEKRRKKLKTDDEIYNDIPSIYHERDSPREESPLPESYPILAGHANDVFRLDKMIKEKRRKKLKADDEIHNDIPSIYHDRDSPREESPLPESYPILAGQRKKLKPDDEIYDISSAIYHDHDSPREDSPLPESIPIDEELYVSSEDIAEKLKSNLGDMWIPIDVAEDIIKYAMDTIEGCPAFEVEI